MASDPNNIKFIQGRKNILMNMMEISEIQHLRRPLIGRIQEHLKRKIKLRTAYKAFDSLSPFSKFGEKILENGTKLICKAPHIAPNAWLHIFFAPLSDVEIIGMENKMHHKIPRQYLDFLERSNGLAVFSTTLSLHGFRKNYIRSEDSVWQPFDLVDANGIERPIKTSKELFIFGAYDWDGSLLAMGQEDLKIVLLDAENSKISFTWENYQTLLNSEITHLLNLFDESGKKSMKICQLSLENLIKHLK